MGLAEKVDVGNQDRCDNGFVFSDIGGREDSNSETWITHLVDTIGHEVGHLLGFAHDDPIESELPLSDVALSVLWDGGGDGVSWSDPLNWSGDALPGAGDDVIINIADDPTVIIDASAGDVSVRSIESDEALRLVSSLLSVDTTITLTDQDLTLSSSTISGATIQSGGGQLIVPNSQTGVLDGVVLDTGLTTVIGVHSNLFVDNGLTLDGLIEMRGNTATNPGCRLIFRNGGTLAGTGQIRFETSTGHVHASAGEILTIDSGITIINGAGDGVVGEAGTAIINRGTVRAENGRTITITGLSIINEGTLEANGGTLALRDVWTNSTGILRVVSGTLDLGGNFATADIGTFERTGGAVNLTGTLDNSSATLALNATTGSWRLRGGRINGGTITDADGSQLIVTSYNGILDGVVLNSDLLVQNVGEVTVFNGLELNGTATLESFGSWTRILFSGSQILTGTGEVVFGGSHDINTIYALNSGDILTIGPGITIRTGTRGGQVGSSNRGLINQGTIISETSSRRIYIYGDNWVNEGLIEAAAGSVYLYNAWDNDGMLRVSGGNLYLGGTFATDDIGTFEWTSGNTYINGTLDNSSATLALNATTGSWRLRGGRINGGTITDADGSQLIVTSYNGILDGVVLNSDLLVQNVGEVTVFNGLELNGTATLESFGSWTRILFSGSQILTGTGEVVFGGSHDINTIYALNSGDILTIGPGITIRTGTRGGQVGSSNRGLINQGTIISETSSRRIYIYGDNWVNEGLIEAAAGSVYLYNAWDNDGTIYAHGGLISASSGQNQGNVIISTGSTFSVSGDYIQTNGTTTLGGGTLDPSGNVELLGGILEGSGSILSNVNNSATVSPGSSAGSLNIQGDYTQSAAGSLDIEIGGLTAGSEFDVLDISGTATLGGTLELTLLEGFSPAPNDNFKVLLSSVRAGTFASINRQDPYVAFGFTPNYEPDGFSLTAFIDDSAGPTVVEHQVEDLFSSRTSPLTQFEVTFNEPIDFNPDGTGSFWLDDIQISGPEQLNKQRILRIWEAIDS